MPKPSHSELPTKTDLDAYGHDECLAVLREEFAGAHRRYDQYAGWTEGTVLGIVQHRIGRKFVHAEPGDLVLVKREQNPRFLAGLTPHDIAWLPRVGMVSSIALGDVEDIHG